MDTNPGSVAVDLPRARALPHRQVQQHASEPHRRRQIPPRLRRLFGWILLASAVAACSSGLGGSEWLWCKEHLASVDAAAKGLQFPKVQVNVEQPRWWPDYETSMLNANNALIAGNADFRASCDAAADKRGVGESRVSWCMADGLGDVWDSSIALGLVVQTQAETFAYKGLPLEQRLTNPEFVAACRAAFAARTN